jgi:hypothetical protein
LSEKGLSAEGGDESIAGMTVDPLAVVIQRDQFPEASAIPLA